jgi:hypothetical protein
MFQIHAIDDELDCLKKNGFLDESSGRLKPSIIETVPGPMQEIVQRFRINAALIEAQMENDSQKIIIRIVEVISNLLEMIDADRDACVRYDSDVKNLTTIVDGLKSKNEKLEREVAEMVTFRNHAVIQVALNHLQHDPTNMILQDIGYDERDFNRLIEKLTAAHLDTIMRINLSGNQLRVFDMDVNAFPKLREIRLTGNPISNITNIEEKMRMSIPGVTSVYRDSKIIVANANSQIRLSVYL